MLIVNSKIARPVYLVLLWVVVAGCVMGSGTSHAEELRLSNLSAEDKVEYLESRRDFINSALSENQRDIVCAGATLESWKDFTDMADYALSQQVNSAEKQISYGELIFFVECPGHSGVSTNPLGRNMDPNTIIYDGFGVTENTARMITETGQFLLEPGPDGRRPLEFVEDMLNEARKYQNRSLLGVYNQIKNIIETRVGQLE